MGLVSETLTVVPLHQRPDLLEACADLINEEWKRSRTSRIHSLQRSSNNFPMCLVLIRPVEDAVEGTFTKNQTQLLGHARLSRVVGRPNSLFVETVVVAKALRGKGYGRKLMEAVENYAKSRGFCHLHLTTHDKQHFYAHLGYHLSKPVQCAGFVSSLVPVEFLESISHPQRDDELPAGSRRSNASSSFNIKSGANFSPLQHDVSPFPSSVCSGASLPPPPPPLPSPHSSHNFFFQPAQDSLKSSSLVSESLSAQNMSATSVPLPIPPPPPPPMPPPMAPVSGQPNLCGLASSGPPGDKAQGQLFLETPYRDLKGQPIFWMEKGI